MPYLDTREVFDASEASRLRKRGWLLEEVRILTRWSRGLKSETTSFVLGLPDYSRRDVAAVSLATRV